MRYIDADALLDEVMDRHCNDCDRRKGIKNGKYRIIYSIGEAPCRACDVDDLKTEIEDAPTIEPERKKGKWIPVTRIEKWHKEDGLVGFPPEVKEFPQCTIEWVDATEPDAVDGLRCSKCGTVYDFTEARNWCSECGADMREGQDDRK